MTRKAPTNSKNICLPDRELAERGHLKDVVDCEKSSSQPFVQLKNTVASFTLEAHITHKADDALPSYLWSFNNRGLLRFCALHHGTAMSSAVQLLCSFPFSTLEDPCRKTGAARQLGSHIAKRKLARLGNASQNN